MSFHLHSSLVLVSWMLGVTTALTGACGTPLGDGTAARPRAAISVWDTNKSSAELLTLETVEQKNGWKAIASSETGHAFQGDAVIANGRLLVVARKQGKG